MRVRKKTSKRVGCAYLTLWLVVLIVQPILLTLKCTGDISWDWWTVFVPFIFAAALPIALVIGVVLALIPAEMLKLWKTTRRLNEEAKRYGMTRLPGESNRELKTRIIRRNMIKEAINRGDSTKK